jgi:glycosyltransferase involved in cell wall biosynthesis
MTDKHLPLITVIIAVFNGGKTIEQCLNSVFLQTYANKELIIIDGGSTDNTVKILKSKQSSIAHWISEKDQGIYDAWNKGLAKAKGDWVCFLGADDYFWDDTVLEEAAKLLYQTPASVRLVYGKVALLNASDQLIYTIGEPWEQSGPKFHYTMSIPHPGTMHRRSLFQEQGTFNKKFRIAGDYELLLRELKNKPATYIPIVMVGMRQGGASSNNKGALLQLYELRQAQRMHGFKWPTIQWMLAVIRVYIRLILWKLVGEKRARKALDYGRALLGKPAYWTRN